MTYEYICTACGHEWEASQPITAQPLKDCPSCSEATARRQVSGGTGFVLKGGGWYADLYSSSSAKKAGEAAEGASPDAKDAKQAAPKEKADSSANAGSSSSKDAPATTTPATAPASSSAGTKTDATA